MSKKETTKIPESIARPSREEVAAAAQTINRTMTKSKIMLTVTKETTIDCAHFLNYYDGDCSNMHGHTYKLQVEVAGLLNDIGMVIDFKELNRIIGNVKSLLDHKVINESMADVIGPGFNPTAEELALIIGDLINQQLAERPEPNVLLVAVRLWETPTSYAEARRDPSWQKTFSPET